MISIKEVECKTELQRGKGPVPSIGKGQKKKKNRNSFSESEPSLQSRQDDGRSLGELIQNNVFSLPLEKCFHTSHFCRRLVGAIYTQPSG